MTRKLSNQTGWTLFLDRDGVINNRLPDDYVKQPNEFEFIPGVTEALASLADIFYPIIIVTNQQGIGRRVMTVEQLNAVHKKMLHEVENQGGRIDKVLFSPDLKTDRSFTRKPAVGMGLKARKLFPEINFKRCIMAGDTFSDILFGHRLGMVTVLIGSDKETAFQCSGILDYSFPDLLLFAEFAKRKTW